MKAGVAVVVVAFAIGGIYSYRIFFPAPSRVVPIKSPPIVKPAPKKDVAAEAADTLGKIAAGPGKLIDKAQSAIANHRERRAGEGGRGDHGAGGADADPYARHGLGHGRVAAHIGHQGEQHPPRCGAGRQRRVPGIRRERQHRRRVPGNPSRALVNGVIVREGQTVNAALGITFDRIDAVKKVIFFKDATGAEVSKSY